MSGIIISYTVLCAVSNKIHTVIKECVDYVTDGLNEAAEAWEDVLNQFEDEDLSDDL